MRLHNYGQKLLLKYYNCDNMKNLEIIKLEEGQVGKFPNAKLSIQYKYNESKNIIHIASLPFINFTV